MDAPDSPVSAFGPQRLKLTVWGKKLKWVWQPKNRKFPKWVARSVSGNWKPKTRGASPSDRLILSHSRISREPKIARAPKRPTSNPMSRETSPSENIAMFTLCHIIQMPGSKNAPLPARTCQAHRSAGYATARFREPCARLVVQALDLRQLVQLERESRGTEVLGS